MLKTYALSTRVTASCGWLTDALVDRVAAYGDRGVLVFGRGSAVRSKTRDEILDRLRAGGIDAAVCAGIGPDGHIEPLRVAALSIPSDAKWLLAIGGGSVIDAAKLLAFRYDKRPLLATAHSVASLSQRLDSSDRLPVLAVPTCLGSGAEVSCLSEVIDERGWKEPVVHSRLAPDEAWVDPVFMLPPPRRVQAAAIADLFFNLFDPLVSGADERSAEDGIAVELCRQLIALVRSVPDLRFVGDAALELAWLGHLAVQPGLTRPRSASVLHRIEHVVSPVLGCAHGEGLAWLGGAFLRRSLRRSPAVARRLVDLTASVFDHSAAPDYAVERFLETLQLVRPSRLAASEAGILAGRAIEAYGHAGRLPGPLKFGLADVEAIIRDSMKVVQPGPETVARSASPVNSVNARRVFGGPVQGEWNQLVLTPLPFVEGDLERWRGGWTHGWYPTLRLEGVERVLVVRTSPGSDVTFDVLTLLIRANARFRSIHLVGLCGALNVDWPIGTWIRPSAAWGDRRQRTRHGAPWLPIPMSCEGGVFERSGVCGSVSTLADETTELLEAWKHCGVDVIDLETFAAASFAQHLDIPISADLVVSDHPLGGIPLWASDGLAPSARRRVVDLITDRLSANPSKGVADDDRLPIGVKPCHRRAAH